MALSPKPAFCLKSKTVPVTSVIASVDNASVQKPQKVFINICSHPKLNNDQIITSSSRNDVDRAGQPSLVFDCIFHPTITARALKDPTFQPELAELALSAVEAKGNGKLRLSRKDISVPNISSKGKPAPFVLSASSSSLQDAHIIDSKDSTSSKGKEKEATIDSATKKKQVKPLIEEIGSTPSSSSLNTPTPSGPITPSGVQGDGTTSPRPNLEVSSAPSPASTPSTLIEQRPISTTDSQLYWTWSRRSSPSNDDNASANDSPRICITIQVPNLTYASIKQTTLDIEPRRVLLLVPGHTPLDINLSLSDAEIVHQHANSNLKGKNLSGQQQTPLSHQLLTLKRQRDLDVDGAIAEWRVADRILVITA